MDRDEEKEFVDCYCNHSKDGICEECLLLLGHLGVIKKIDATE